MQQLVVGNIVEGKVTGITKFGAFVDLGMSKVWCGYYDGNLKSKRVQEKLGFRYQWTAEDVDVPLMHEKRTVHASCMTKAEWENKGR